MKKNNTGTIFFIKLLISVIIMLIILILIKANNIIGIKIVLSILYFDMFLMATSIKYNTTYLKNIQLKLKNFKKYDILK